MMVFRLSRQSRLPLLLEEDEKHTLETLEAQGRWSEVSDYEDELRADLDSMKEIEIEAFSLEELYLALNLFDPHAKFLIDFIGRTILIMDSGVNSV